MYATISTAGAVANSADADAATNSVADTTADYATDADSESIPYR